MSSDQVKGFLLSVPVLGSLLRIGKHIYLLPNRQAIQDRKLTSLQSTLTQALEQALPELRRRLAELQDQLDHTRRIQDDIQKQLGLFDKNMRQLTTQTKERPIQKADDLFADDHLLDIFYANFEDRFRGKEEMIAQRLEEYLPYIFNSKHNYNKHPVLDIGCGRGEFLQLLKKNQINAVGLDINIDMVERAHKKGLKAEQGEALNFLEDSESQKYSVVSGFHIVEHIPFSALLRIFASAYRTLIKDGFVIFETPNPENLIVGSCTFYMDPSHLHPLPPDLLAFALETVGFRDIEIKRIHPDEHPVGSTLPSEVVSRLYGPRDYAVIGYKK